jgi:hypothetical protein
MFALIIFCYAAILAMNGLLFLYFAEVHDVTLFTPVFFAGLLILMGMISLKDDLKLYGQHGATGLSVLAFITSVGSFTKLFALSFSNITYSDMSDFITAICSIGFLIFAVFKFGHERSLKENVSQK